MTPRPRSLYQTAAIMVALGLILEVCGFYPRILMSVGVVALGAGIGLIINALRLRRRAS